MTSYKYVQVFTRVPSSISGCCLLNRKVRQGQKKTSETHTHDFIQVLNNNNTSTDDFIQVLVSTSTVPSSISGCCLLNMKVRQGQKKTSETHTYDFIQVLNNNNTNADDFIQVPVSQCPVALFDRGLLPLKRRRSGWGHLAVFCRIFEAIS
jgi:hypothetical protein